MKKIVLGTAGHIDHGKTSLVRKLTGIDTDRLEEEKRRGMTIELGFASLTLPSGQVVSIIDVPGHEKFVKTMVAGVTGIDLVMLVIAADEGIMPQTQEHLDIINLLQVKSGLVALTKTDLVDEEWLAMVVEDIQMSLQGTTLAGCPIIPVSSVTGEGIPLLLEELDKLAAQVQAKESQGLFRLPIDRVFSMTGYGTVVTGTIISGKVTKSELLAVYPSQKEARVKGVQVHNTNVEEAVAGDRCALNLTGIEKTDINRGDTIAPVGQLSPIWLADAVIFMVKGKGSLVHNQRVHVHTGTKEVLARVRLIGAEEIPEGSKGYVQLRFEEPVVVLRKDRFIIRSYSPEITIGGGWILYHHTKNRRRFNEESIKAMEAGEKGTLAELIGVVCDFGEKPLNSEDIWRALYEDRSELQEALEREVQSGKLILLKEVQKYISSDLLAKYLEKIKLAFAKLYEKSRYRYQIDKEEMKSGVFPEMDAKDFGALINYFVSKGKLKSEGNFLSEPGGVALERIRASKEIALVEENFLAYDVKGGSIQQVAKDTNLKESAVGEIVKYLQQSEKLVDLGQGVIVHQEAFKKMFAVVRSLLDSKGSINVGEVRDELNIGRKTVIIFLEYLDSQKITKRKEDIRIPGVRYQEFLNQDSGCSQDS